MSQRAEAAIRRAGTLVALPAASALLPLLFVPAGVERGQLVVLVVLPLFLTWLTGSAAVLLSPAHRAVTELGRRGAAAARGLLLARAPLKLRWAGFTCVVLCLCAAHVVLGHVRMEEAAAAAAAVQKVIGSLLFMAFLAGVWMVNLSMLRPTGSGPAAAAVEEQPASGEVNVVLVLPLFLTWLAGSAAIVLSPANRAVAELAWRGTEAARGLLLARAPLKLRWAGFTCVLLYAAAAHVVEDHVRKAAKEEAAVQKVIGFLLFVAFLAVVWMVNLSMLTPTGSGPAAAEEQPASGEVNAVLPPYAGAP